MYLCTILISSYQNICYGMLKRNFAMSEFSVKHPESLRHFFEVPKHIIYVSIGNTENILFLLIYYLIQTTKTLVIRNLNKHDSYDLCF